MSYILLSIESILLSPFHETLVSSSLMPPCPVLDFLMINSGKNGTGTDGEGKGKGGWRRRAMD